MKTRILKTKLAEPLKRHLDGDPKSALAERIGVSPQKLNAMMSDQWEYITRDALERTADFLELEVSEIFELVPVDFWRPIEEANGYILLRGSQSPTVKDREILLPKYDDLASQVVKNFMRKSLGDVAEPPVVEHHQDEKELMKKARSQNCVVIGSPKTSAATEILLSRFFGAEPFDSTLANRRKIPFGFCWPDSSSIVQSSSLTCSELAREEVKNVPGIATMDGVHIRADLKPPDEFRAWKTKEGLDCGLVFVANRPFETKNNIKLIVLAGFGGIGTLAAAKALVEDFRCLEPVGEETCVYGIVEGKYRKSAHTEVREFRSFHWRYRKGGHSPIG
jgi:DNA-binding Xre family transcriptional regulator